MNYLLPLSFLILLVCKSLVVQPQDLKIKANHYFSVNIMTGGHYQDKINNLSDYGTSQFRTNFFPRKINLLYHSGRFKLGGGWAKYFLATEPKTKINYPFINYKLLLDRGDWKYDEQEEVFLSLGYAFVEKPNFSLSIYGESGIRLFDDKEDILIRVGVLGEYEFTDQISVVLYPALQHYFFAFGSLYGGLKFNLSEHHKGKLYTPDTAAAKRYRYGLSLGSSVIFNNANFIFNSADYGKLYEMAFIKLRNTLPIIEFLLKKQKFLHTFGTGYRNSVVVDDIGYGFFSQRNRSLQDFRGYYQFQYPINKQPRKNGVFFIGSGIELGYKHYLYSSKYFDGDISTYTYYTKRQGKTAYGLLQYTMGNKWEWGRVFLSAGINLNIAGIVMGTYIIDNEVWDFQTNPDPEGDILINANYQELNFTKFKVFFPIQPGEIQDNYHLHSLFLKIGYFLR